MSRGAGIHVARLEDIRPGAQVRGVIGGAAVTVVAVAWHGNMCLTLTYRTEAGALGETMLFRQDEGHLSLAGSSSRTFDAPTDDLKLASEAYRIHLAHLFDPYLAVRTSAIGPLPHQISAVYKDMLPKMPLRFVLADDPGAGKTIMTGLLIKEMIARGDLKRCLIVSPGNLVEQWQDELHRKFGLTFTILTNDLLEASVTRNAFAEQDLCIARLDKLTRNPWFFKRCDPLRRAYTLGVPNEEVRLGLRESLLDPEWRTIGEWMVAEG